MSKCVFPVKRKKKSTRPPKKLDTRLNDDKKAKLVQFIDEKMFVCDTEFVELKDILQNAATHVFGKNKRIQNDWFDDQQSWTKLLGKILA